MLHSRTGGRAINTASYPNGLTSSRSLTDSRKSLLARFLTTEFPSFVLVENPNRAGRSPTVGISFKISSLWTKVRPPANTRLKSRLLVSLCCFCNKVLSSPLRRYAGNRRPGKFPRLDCCKVVSSFGASGLNYVSSVFCRHFAKETMGSMASSYFRLKSSFH